MKNLFAQPESKTRAIWRIIRSSNMTDIALDPYSPSSVRNLQIVELCESLDKAVWEMFGSTSSSLNFINPEDMVRVIRDMAAIRTQAETTKNAPRMDLPYTSPTQYPINWTTEGLDFNEVTNNGLRSLIRLLVNGWMQWSRSESADNSNGLSDYDYGRFLLIMDNVDAVIDGYLKATGPLDLPASSRYGRAEVNETRSNGK
jgi:hypothetical protein